MEGMNFQNVQYYLGVAVFLVIQISKSTAWWPGKKAGKPWDPRPLLLALSAVAIGVSAFFLEPNLPIGEIDDIAKRIVFEDAVKITGTGILAHYGWQKVRNPLKKVGGFFKKLF